MKYIENKQTNRITNSKMKELVNKIDNGLIEFIKQGKYKQVLISLGNLSHYSFNNQIYIMLQKQDASTVYTFKKWNKLGRFIKSKEKGIKIFKPIIKKEIDENDNQKSNLLGFQVGYVFDISQTEGEKIEVFQFDKAKIVSNKKDIISSLEIIIKSNNYNLIYVSEKELGTDCFGLCDHKNKVIKLRDDLVDLQEISTCVHEIGHMLAHSEYRKDFEGLTLKEKREIKEIEAESIACIVCTYLNLDTSNFNFSYILGWSEGDISKFRKNIDVISFHAKNVINQINNQLNEAF